MESFDAQMRLYDYALPPELIAKAPAHPRDSARLLVYDRKKKSVLLDTFAHITDHLPQNAVLVLNETRVIPARMELTKATGGIVRALYLEGTDTAIRTMAEGKIQAGDVLQWEGDHSFTVLAREGKEAVLQPSFPLSQLMELLQQYGHTPLPPYMKDSPLTEAERRTEYQTVFAHTPGSVAAPTAGLHFTEELLERIRKKGIAIATVTLHVNLGTFAPLTETHWREQRLHQEHYTISPETAAMLNGAKRESRPIIAVGTTVVRTLESAAQNGVLAKLSGITDLFLSEDHPPRFVDGLVTNFHVPQSSLLMLVAGLTGRETLMQLYARAIAERMRFFSFGDGMLIL